jgi:hypothetical protein
VKLNGYRVMPHWYGVIVIIDAVNLNYRKIVIVFDLDDDEKLVRLHLGSTISNQAKDRIAFVQTTRSMRAFCVSSGQVY